MCCQPQQHRGQFSCSLFSGAVLALFGTHSAVFFAGALVAMIAIACSLVLRSAIGDAGDAGGRL